MIGELIFWGVLALMVIAASRRYDKKLTVEQEEAKAREVAAHAPQWKNFPHPRTGQRSPLSSSSKSAPGPIVKPGSWKVAAVAPETREYDEWDVDDSTPESVSTFSRERGKAS